MDENLQFAVEHGIIDLSQIQREVEEMKREELLRKHKHGIWQGDDGRWKTYIGEGTERKLISRRTRYELETLIASYIQEEVISPTVGQVFTEWNDWKLELKKICESTAGRNRYIFKRFYGEKFAKRKIKSLEPENFRDFLEEQIPKYNLSAKDFSNLKSVTRGFLKFAKRKGYIAWNYEYMLSDVEVSDRDFRKTKKEDYEEVYSDDEMQKIVEYLLNNLDQMNMGLLLLFITGIRVGELATLKPENIEEDCVTIRRTETKWKDKDGHWHIDVKDFPKSEAGWRTVVVPSGWQWLLTRLKMLNSPGGWVFDRVGGRMKGKRMDVKVFENRLHVVNNLLGIYHKSPHKIRKTYCTILLDTGMDDNFVIQQMGHTSILTSEQHYHRNRKSICIKKSMLDSISDFRITSNQYNVEKSLIL